MQRESETHVFSKIYGQATAVCGTEPTREAAEKQLGGGLRKIINNFSVMKIRRKKIIWRGWDIYIPIYIYIFVCIEVIKIKICMYIKTT